MADLQDLLSKLQRPANSEAQSSGARETVRSSSYNAFSQASSFQPPTISSPLFPPPLSGNQNNRMASLGSLATPASPLQERSDRATNLLNLLKFNQPIGTPSPLGNGSTPASSAPAPSTFAPAAAGPLSTENPQDMLLKLLGRPQPSSVEVSAKSPPPADPFVFKANTSSGDVNVQSREATPAKATAPSPITVPTPSAPASISKGSVFTYVNPFEQLAASSPRNRTPKPGDIVSAASFDETPTMGNGKSSLSGLPSAAAPVTPSPLPDGRSQIEALIGIGSQNRNGESVAHALVEVAERIDKQVEGMAAKANEEFARLNATEEHRQSRELQQAVHEAAVEMNEELKNKETRNALEEAMPKPAADAFRQTVKNIAQDITADSWESAEAEESAADADRAVPVYNLPMRPFVTIEVNLPKAAHPVRDDIVMKIASLKKDFDQVDRTLVTASTTNIVYATAKSGGFRLIRQDDGSNKHVFKHGDNQIFNVAVSTVAANVPSGETETIIATGVNGSVYWTSTKTEQDESFAGEDLEKQGLIFPPIPSTDDNNTSNAQLKTRAKRSSRHPDFFALGRGKSIHIIWPSVAASDAYVDSKTRIVDSEKYLSERCLKISTGKAGKDFAFSEDDTVIASLDKAGKLKFWDIREHIDKVNAEPTGRRSPVEAKTPIFTLQTVSGGDKSWPTSLLFVDKERPSVKGVALRYLLVGMKQNHTLQLWDLGLGKPVQELNFPHDAETDAICSVAYHPKSGVIVVGHPTRNSIYLVHLSAPKYNLPSMTQAKFLQSLADKDETLPKPDSTAIMSGIREISLASIGELRSLDIMNPINSSIEEKKEDETMFELYLMHSRGVISLNFKRQDLGWGPDNKPLRSLDAEKEGVVTVKELRAIDATPSASDPVESTNAMKEQSTTSAVKPIAAKPVAEVATPAPQKPAAKELVSQAEASTATSGETAEPKKKRHTEAQPVAQTAPSSSKPSSQPVKSSSAQAQRAPEGTPGTTKRTAPVEPVTSQPDAAPALLSSSGTPTEVANALANSVGKVLVEQLTGGVAKNIDDQLKTLYRRLDEDKRVADAAGSAKQDAVLRLVASTLSENVEKSLTRIISSNMQQSVLPSLSAATATALDRKLPEILSQRLETVIPRELKAILPNTISRSLQDPEDLKMISELVSTKIAKHVEADFAKSLRDTITPAFKTLATTAAQKVTSEVEQRVREQLKHAEVQRQSESVKIDQLTKLTGELLETVRSMATSQADLRDQISELQAQLSTQQLAVEPEPQQPVRMEPQAPHDEDLEAISELMTNGRYEEGTIRVCTVVLL